VKTFVFYVFVKPLPTSTHFRKVKAGYATVWSVSDDIATARINCKKHLNDTGWRVIRVEESAEITAEQCEGDVIQKLCFQKAQIFGCSAEIAACSTDAAGGDSFLN